MLEFVKSERFQKIFYVISAGILVCGFLFLFFILMNFALLDYTPKNDVDRYVVAILGAMFIAFVTTNALLLLSYILAIFAFSKRAFVYNMLGISIFVATAFYWFDSLLYKLPYIGFESSDKLVFNTIFLTFYSTLWGVIALFMPEKYFSKANHKIKPLLGILFYIIIFCFYFLTDSR